ncbi:UNVERIFIED_CONTAM: hypothetical protein Slati_3768100 [Sesamum latifolium]|uniref:Uncharacterized protein n=1 Tax=Sesamum latifolium TaxID=2727402 RepID=A0AAW2U4P8_9LAMI
MPRVGSRGLRVLALQEKRAFATKNIYNENTGVAKGVFCLPFLLQISSQSAVISGHHSCRLRHCFHRRKLRCITERERGMGVESLGEWLEKALTELYKKMETRIGLDGEIISGLVSYCKMELPLDAK